LDEAFHSVGDEIVERSGHRELVIDLPSDLHHERPVLLDEAIVVGHADRVDTLARETASTAGLGRISAARDLEAPEPHDS
jgi:hypothetical protein